MNPTLGEIIVGVLRDYLKRNNLKSLVQITAETVQNEINERVAPCWSPKKPRAAPKAKTETTEEEWLDHLQAQPAMRGVNVRQEHGKYLFWCGQAHNRIYPTRRRFANWLLKADRGMSGQPARPLETPKKHGLEEPHLWREWMQRETPNSMWIDDPNWDSIPVESQRMIQGAMKLTKIA